MCLLFFRFICLFSGTKGTMLPVLCRHPAVLLIIAAVICNHIAERGIGIKPAAAVFLVFTVFTAQDHIHICGPFFSLQGFNSSM